MHKLFIIFFLSCFYHSFLQAEIIKKVEISGNKRVNGETIKIYGDIHLNKDYSEQDLNKILTNLYSTNFFEDVKISLEKTNDIKNLQYRKKGEIFVILDGGLKSNNNLLVLSPGDIVGSETIEKLIEVFEIDKHITFLTIK